MTAIRFNRVALAIMGMGLIATGGIVYGLGRTREQSPGMIVPVQSSIVWKSPSVEYWKSKQFAEITFTIINKGGREVKMTGITSGCGCVEPEIEPAVLEPRQAGSVKIKAIPFDVGERTVNLTLRTDSPITPIVPLTFTMIGSREAPFLMKVDGDLTYYRIGTDISESRLFVKTIEKADEPYKEPTLVSDLKFLQFEIGGVTQKPHREPGTVLRTYEVRVAIAGLTDENFISGTVKVVDPWNPSLSFERKVFIKTLPRFKVFPKEVALSEDQAEPGKRSGRLNVVMADSAADISLIPKYFGNENFISIKMIKNDRNPRLVEFEISSTLEARILEDERLVLDCNGETLEVPLRVETQPGSLLGK